MRVLIVEDDLRLRQALAGRLRQEAFAVDEAPDGDEGLYAGQEFPIDLAIIDLGLPGQSGIDVIRALRKGGARFPILILTARDRWQDKVLGLESGADDYMTKPFEVEEVLARVRALLRRSSGFADAEIRCGPLTLQSALQKILMNGKEVELTAFEYKTLAYLMHKAGEVVSKTELSDHLYEQDQDRDSNVLEVIVGRLRKKLDPKGKLQPIETLRGRGYRLALTRA